MSASHSDRQRSALALFSAELKAARAAAGLSQDELAGKIAYSSSLIAMIEGLRRVPSLDFATRLDEALATSGSFARIQPLVAGEAYPSWFREFALLEKTATTLRSWESCLVPGLLQVEGYARAVLRAAREADDDAAIDEAVAARIERQAILDGDDAPMAWFVIDEAVIQRPVGGPGVMTEQFDRLIVAARRPRIKLQVLPFAAGEHAGMTGAFVVASFTTGPDVALLETARGGMIAENDGIVSECVFSFDSLRADALSPQETITMLQGEVAKWVQQT